MLASACSAFNFTQSYSFHTFTPKRTKKSSFLRLVTKILIFILCYHALLHHGTDNLPEIEEEEPEFVIMISPGVKRSAKKEQG